MKGYDELCNSWFCIFSKIPCEIYLAILYLSFGTTSNYNAFKHYDYNSTTSPYEGFRLENSLQP